MKTSIIYLITGLLVINSLSAQVKIGDRPQNLDPASVLELESTSRVLVITRVTDVQMNNISPLQGAVVYNTDQDCLHYYNGTEWINICEALDNSFTTSTRADSLLQVNPQARDNTVIISEIINPDGSTNYNFEVGEINSANIPTGAVNGDDIQGDVILNRHLRNGTINKDKFQPATQAGDLFMYNGSTWNFVNRSDLLNTQLDSIVGNEVVGPFDSTLKLEGEGNIDEPYTLDVADGGIDTAELANDAVTTEKILNGTIAKDDIADNVVTTDKIGTDPVTDTNKILGTDGAGDPQWQDAATLATSLGENVSSSNNSILGVQDNATLIPMDLEVNVDGSTIEIDGTTGQLQIMDGGVTNDKLDKINIPLSGFSEAETNVSMGNFKINDLQEPTLDADAATKNYVDTEIINNAADGSETILQNGTNTTVNGSGTSLDPYSIDVPDNTDNQDLTISGNILSLTGDATTVTLPQADGSETILQNGTNTTVNGSGTSLDPYSIDVPDNTDNQDLTISGNILSLTGDATTVTLPQADGSETILQNGTNTTVNGSGTSLDPYSIDVPENTTLATNNLIQTDANRSYDIGSGTLNFTNGSVGVGTVTQTSTLQTGGSFAANIRNSSNATINILDTDYTVIVDSATDIILPLASASNFGRIYIIKNITGGPITMSSEDYLPSDSGTPTFVLQTGVTQLQSDGTNWQQIN